MTDQFNVGDRVQGRREGEGEPVEIVDGFVTSCTSKAITLGTREYIVADGWGFELIQALLVFPEVLTEIIAQLHSEHEPVPLMGRGQIWSRSSDGRTVPVYDIKAFEVVL